MDFATQLAIYRQGASCVMLLPMLLIHDTPREKYSKFNMTMCTLNSFMPDFGVQIFVLNL